MYNVTNTLLLPIIGCCRGPVITDGLGPVGAGVVHLVAAFDQDFTPEDLSNFTGADSLVNAAAELCLFTPEGLSDLDPETWAAFLNSSDVHVHPACARLDTTASKIQTDNHDVVHFL